MYSNEEFKIPEVNNVDDIDVQRVNTLVYYFLIIYNKPDRQQHGDLCNILSAVVKYLKEDENYNLMINEIKLNPISYYLKENKEYISKSKNNTIDDTFNLAELDHLYFRDTISQFGSKLKKEYKSYNRKSMFLNKKINLSLVVTVMTFIRKKLFDSLMVIAQKNKLSIPEIPIPEVNNYIKYVGSGQNADRKG